MSTPKVMSSCDGRCYLLDEDHAEALRMKADRERSLDAALQQRASMNREYYERARFDLNEAPPLKVVDKEPIPNAPAVPAPETGYSALNDAHEAALTPPPARYEPNIFIELGGGLLLTAVLCAMAYFFPPLIFAVAIYGTYAAIKSGGGGGDGGASGGSSF